MTFEDDFINDEDESAAELRAELVSNIELCRRENQEYPSIEGVELKAALRSYLERSDALSLVAENEAGKFTSIENELRALSERIHELTNILSMERVSRQPATEAQRQANDVFVFPEHATLN